MRCRICIHAAKLRIHKPWRFEVATQYCDLDGNVSMDEEWNVNGSYMAIEGITSPDGRVLGKMAHSERRGDSVAINIYGERIHAAKLRIHKPWRFVCHNRCVNHLRHMTSNRIISKCR